MTRYAPLKAVLRGTQIRSPRGELRTFHRRAGAAHPYAQLRAVQRVRRRASARDEDAVGVQAEVGRDAAAQSVRT